jgi:hypothetical protein
MAAPTPRNPKGAGRKPSPKRKPTQSFRPDQDIEQFLSTLTQKGEKTDLINQAIREYILRQKQTNG